MQPAVAGGAVGVSVAEEKMLPAQFERKISADETYVYHCLFTMLNKKKRGGWHRQRMFFSVLILSRKEDALAY